MSEPGRERVCHFWNCLCNHSYAVLAGLLELRVIQWFQSLASFFFSLLPFPAPLSLSSLFGLKISFPNFEYCFSFLTSFLLQAFIG